MDDPKKNCNGQQKEDKEEDVHEKHGRQRKNKMSRYVIWLGRRNSTPLHI